MTKDDYAAYLATPEWKKRRDAAVKRAGGRCQLCNSAKSLNAHHRTYKRVGNEDPWDLTVLCRRCHEKFHDIVPGQPKPVRAVKPRKEKDLRSCDEIDQAIIALLPSLPRRKLSARVVAPLVPCTPGRAGSSLRRLAHRGILVQLSKKTYVAVNAKLEQMAARRVELLRKAA